MPDEAKKAYDEAQDHYAQGDLKKAYSAISKARAKEPLSADYWELYVRIWRGLGKDEATLWDKIVAKVEAKHAKSAVFDLVRARFEDDPAKRLALLQSAAKKDPESIEARVQLARSYVKTGEDALADRVLSEILDKDPKNEVALVTKADLLIESGRSQSALEFVEDALGSNDVPGLHDAAARALLHLAMDDATKLKEAEEEAKKAVAARADAHFVVTLASILDREGKSADAVKALSDGYASTKSSVIAAKLGEMAFREGEYGKALPGLALLAEKDPHGAAALAVAHARLGDAKEARAALQRLLKVAPDEKSVAAGIELLLGDPAAARGYVTADADHGWWFQKTYALEGNADKVKALVGEGAGDGSRGNEEKLLLLLEARLRQALGAKAAAFQKGVLEARHTAARGHVAAATVPDGGVEEPVTLKSMGFMGRYVTYRTNVEGAFFSPQGIQPYIWQKDGKAYFSLAMLGQSDCEKDKTRLFPFNPVEIKKGDGNVEVKVPGRDEGWDTTVEVFQSGAKALYEGDHAKAVESFTKVATTEPAWARAALFGAVAKALGGDAKGGAQMAAEAEKGLDPGDDEARIVAMLTEALGGLDVKPSAKAWAEGLESRCQRHIDEL